MEHTYKFCSLFFSAVGGVSGEITHVASKEDELLQPYF